MSIQVRKLTAEEVIFTVQCEPEDIPLEGNVMCSDDKAFDRQCEDNIRRQLNDGNEWAWCIIKVSATYIAPNDQSFVGKDYLGGCSYESKEDFMVGNSDYFNDMKDNALEDLNTSIANLAEAFTPLTCESWSHEGKDHSGCLACEIEKAEEEVSNGHS
jgi:hypothetical protein